MDFRGLSDPVVIFNKPNKKPGIFQKIKPPTTDFFKNKKILGGALTVMLLFAVGLGVFLTQKPTQLAPQADEAGADISIQPPTQTVAVSQEFESDVFINTNDLSISAVKVKIDFDSKLELIDVTLGTFLPTFLIQPVITDSSVSFTIASNPAKKGSGVLAKLKFKPDSDASGSAVIGFDQAQTEAAATESGSLNQATGFLGSQITITSETTQFCSSTSDCPTGYYCPTIPVASGVASDPICQLISSPSPSPSASASASPSPSPLASPRNEVPAGSDGDANSDGILDLQDLSILFTQWSPATDITGFFNLDLNDDNRINSIDYSLFKQMLVDYGIIRT
jgi:hypothetical protein